MMNMKKLLALLLAVVMVIGMFPMGAMAEETEPTETTVPETTAAAAQIDEADPCEVCGETTCTETHVQCTTCGTWDCKETHNTTPPAPTDPVPPATTTTPATTTPSTPVVKCDVCGEAHGTNNCTACPYCKHTECTCQKCDCGMVEGHTPDCTKKPCEECKKNPCECVKEEIIEEPQVDITEEPYNPPSGFINVAGLMPRKQSTAYNLRRFLRTTPAEEESSSVKDHVNVITTKSVDVNNAGKYTLTLESYIEAGTEQENIPVDIVLVLDQSGSMRACYEHGGNPCSRCIIARMVINDCWDSTLNNGKTHLWKINDKNDDVYETDNKNATLYYNYYPNGVAVSSADKNPNIKKDQIYYFYNPLAAEGYGDIYLVRFCEVCDRWVKVGIHTTNEGANICSGELGVVETKHVENDTTNTSDYYGYFLKYDEDERNCIPRRDALKYAVNDFLESVKQDSENREVVNNVAIVGFAAKTVNTEILANMTPLADENDLNGLKEAMEAFEAKGITRTDLGMELAKDILNANSIKNNGHNKVVIVFTDGEPTIESDGPDPIDPTDKQVSLFNKGTANKALEVAEEIKQNATVYVIGIFSGADGTRGETLPPYNDWEWKQYDGQVEARENATNRFCHLLSSNYVNVQNMLAGGTLNASLKATDAGYFISPGDYSALLDAFDRIANTLKGDATLEALNSGARMQDVISNSFQVDSTRGITAHSVSYAGNGTWATTPDTNTYTVGNPEDAPRTITVTGFNYYDNRVADLSTTDASGTTTTTPVGKKLVLTIPIEPNPDFLGGNGVPTNNEETSGIYDTNGNLIENFTSPILNIPVKTIQPMFKTGNIYLGEEAMVPHVANVGHFRYGEDADNDGLLDNEAETDGINNAYVDIVYTIEDKDGNSITRTLAAGTDHDDLKHNDDEWNPVKGNLDMTPLLYEDGTYQVTAAVSPTDKTTVDSLNHAPVGGTVTGPTEQNILVYKPHITFHDSTMDYGQTANYEGEVATNPVAKNLDRSVDIVWKHGNDVADSTEMGLAPILTFTYSPTAGQFHKETAVQVTAVTPSNDVSEVPSAYDHRVPENEPQDLVYEVFFYRNGSGDKKCTYSECDNPTTTEITVERRSDANPNPTWTNFVVHLNLLDLTIHKEIDGGTNPEESFLFLIACEDYDFEMTVLIPAKDFLNGKASITVKGLPSGDYTVEELTDWSWRYKLIGTSDPRLVEVNGRTASITFKNQLDENHWFSGDCYVENWWQNGTIVKR